MLDLLSEPGGQLVYTPPASLDRDVEFERARTLYPELRIEMDRDGNIVMTPGYMESGYYSGQAYAQLNAWAQLDGSGRAFDSSTLFNLPDGSKMCPDASWVPLAVIRAMVNEGPLAKQVLCPHFVVEVVSPSDRLTAQQSKCQDWLRNGALEVLLVDPKDQAAYRYLPNAEPASFLHPDYIETRTLPNFVLDCRVFWENLFS